MDRPCWVAILSLAALAAPGCATEAPVTRKREQPFWELSPRQHPPTTKLKVTVYPRHPRLVFRPKDDPGLGLTFEERRALYKTDPTFEALFDRALQVKLDRQHPAMLAACWIISQDDKYAAAAIDLMLTRKLSKSGEPYYSRVWSYALAYDWLHHHPAFTESKKKKVVARIIERIKTELDDLDDQGMAVWHGRNQAANGVMIAALGVAEHLDAKILRRATAHYVDALRALQYSEGWPEGASYWIYNRAGPYPLAADCVMTATGLETLDGIPVREVMGKIGLWQIYQYAPNGTFEPYGDSSGSLRLGHTGWWSLTADHYARLSRQPALMAGADYFRNRSPRPYGRRPYYWHVAFTYDPNMRPKKGYDPAKPESWMRDHLPQAMLFGRNSMGVAFLRGAWGDPNEVYATFKAGDFMAHHDHYDAGHFSIQAGGLLAPQTGLYSVGYWSDHRLGYTVQTVSANSLLVMAAGETAANLRRRRRDKKPVWKWLSGGQRVIRPTGFNCCSVKHYVEQLNAGPRLERATITAFESVPHEYDYIAADITAAYNSTRWAEPGTVAKVSLVTRQFLYLRRQGTFLVYDRVETTDDKFLPKFLLHHLSKPQSKTERLLAGKERRNGILETTDRVLTTTHKQGTLVHHILLPEKARALKIGGPDYDCYVEKDGDQANGFNGVNLGLGRKAYDKERKTAQLGRWRTEVEPAERATSTRFLNALVAHVSQPAKRADRIAPVLSVVDAGPKAHAVQAGQTVVVFARDPRPLREITLGRHSGRTCIVLDAVPGATYASGGHKVTAGKEGVLVLGPGWPGRSPIRLLRR